MRHDVIVLMSFNNSFTQNVKLHMVTNVTSKAKSCLCIRHDYQRTCALKYNTKIKNVTALAYSK